MKGNLFGKNLLSYKMKIHLDVFCASMKKTGFKAKEIEIEE
jgi:hypothetical protein